MHIFKFFDFLHEVRTLKALQTGIEVALSKYLFYWQLRGQYTKNIESGIRMS